MATFFAGMAASLDGFVRSASGDLSWLDDAMAPGEDYGSPRPRRAPART
jgi:hypothetical protein